MARGHQRAREKMAVGCFITVLQHKRAGSLEVQKLDGLSTAQGEQDKWPHGTTTAHAHKHAPAVCSHAPCPGCESRDKRDNPLCGVVNSIVMLSLQRDAAGQDIKMTCVHVRGQAARMPRRLLENLASDSLQRTQLFLLPLKLAS